MRTAIDIIKEKSKPMITVSPETTICDALKKMVENKIGAIVVTDNEKIVGIWTERDLMRNVLDSNFNLKEARIGDYMTTGLQTVSHTASIATILSCLAKCNKRHLLVVEKDTYIGIITSVDTIRAELDERTKKYQELNTFISWEYYENWR